MGKHQHQHRKKSRYSQDLLDTATTALKNFRRFTTEVRKLSTAQKVVGGVALATAGLVYLAKRQAAATPLSAPAEPLLTSTAADLDQLKAATGQAGSAPTEGPRKPKRKKHQGSL